MDIVQVACPGSPHNHRMHLDGPLRWEQSKKAIILVVFKALKAALDSVQ